GSATADWATTAAPATPVATSNSGANGTVPVAAATPFRKLRRPSFASVLLLIEFLPRFNSFIRGRTGSRRLFQHAGVDRHAAQALAGGGKDRIGDGGNDRRGFPVSPMPPGGSVLHARQAAVKPRKSRRNGFQVSFILAIIDSGAPKLFVSR